MQVTNRPKLREECGALSALDCNAPIIEETRVRPSAFEISTREKFLIIIAQLTASYFGSNSRSLNNRILLLKKVIAEHSIQALDSNIRSQNSGHFTHPFELFQASNSSARYLPESAFELFSGRLANYTQKGRWLEIDPLFQ